MNKRIVVLFRGLPNSGKSTLSRLLTQVTFAADDYFIDADGVYRYDPSFAREAHRQCITNTEVAMRHGLRIGVANTFTRQWEMQPYFDLAAKYGYTIFSVVVENRHENPTSNGHDVPIEIVQAMHERFELKLLGIGHE